MSAAALICILLAAILCAAYDALKAKKFTEKFSDEELRRMLKKV